jgi:hypothetical protein
MFHSNALRKYRNTVILRRSLQESLMKNKLLGLQADGSGFKGKRRHLSGAAL